MEGIVECEYDVLNIIVTIGKVGDSFAKRLEIRRRTETFENGNIFEIIVFIRFATNSTHCLMFWVRTHVYVWGKGKNCHIGIEIPLLIDEKGCLAELQNTSHHSRNCREQMLHSNPSYKAEKSRPLL